jgi:tetratricopeptide (TPR) repeat protein
MKLHSLFCLICLLPGIAGCSSKTGVIRSYLPEKPSLEDRSERLRQQILGAYESIDSGQQPLESFSKLAKVFHANGFLNEAIICYEGLTVLEENEPKWKHFLATLLSGYGYADDAIRLWEDAIQLDPSYAALRIRLGDTYLKKNEPERAEQVYLECLEIDPGNPYAKVGLARIAIQGGDWVSAEALLEEASSVSKGKIGRDLLVTVYENLGKDYEAFSIRGEAKASGSFVDIEDPWVEGMMEYCLDPDALMNIAGYAAFRGNPSKAIKWAKRAYKEAPENPLVHFQLASFYVEKGNLEKAEHHFLRTIDLDSTFADAWLRLVMIYRFMGDLKKSERYFYDGYSHCPNSPTFKLENAKRLKEQNLLESAIGEIKASIELRPNEAYAYIMLSQCLLLKDRHEEAVQALETALQVESGHPLAMISMCLYRILSEDRASADRWLVELRRHPRIDKPTIEDLESKYAEVFQVTP